MGKVIPLLVLTGAGFLAWGVAAPISSLAVAGVILLASGIFIMRYAR